MPEIRKLLPPEKRFTKFLFGKPDPNTKVSRFICYKIK